MAPSRFISAAQVSVSWSSRKAASSLPASARISARLSTGKSGRAERAPNSNTAVIFGVTLSPMGVCTSPASSRLTRPSQKSDFIACRLKAGGALRGMKVPSGCTRSGPRPVAPWPIERLRPSPVAKPGQVAGHAGDVAVAAQYLVEGEGAAKPDEGGPDGGWIFERGDSPSGSESANFGSERPVGVARQGGTGVRCLGGGGRGRLVDVVGVAASGHGRERERGKDVMVRGHAHFLLARGMARVWLGKRVEWASQSVAETRRGSLLQFDAR